MTDTKTIQRRITRSKTAISVKSSLQQQDLVVGESDIRVARKATGTSSDTKTIQRQPDRITRSNTTIINNDNIRQKRKSLDILMSTAKKIRFESPILLSARKKKPKKLTSSILSLRPSFRPFEFIWAHIRGFSNWPGIIESETPKGRYRIHFFGDYTHAEVTKGKIMHMIEGFNQFATMTTATYLLKKAIGEAQYFTSDNNRNSCPICDMLVLKSTQTLTGRKMLT